MSVQYYDIVLKNTTSSGVSIPDLSGLYIPASGTRDITDLFPFQRLIYSEDLDDLVVSSGIVLSVEGVDLDVDRAQVFLSHHDATHIQGIPIGSGNDRVRTRPELTSTSGTLLVQYDRDEERIKLDGINFLSLSDTPTTYSGQAGQTAAVNDTESGLIFTYAQPGATATGTTPPDPGDTNLWYNNYDHQLYYWDEDRLDWLSIMSHYYTWTAAGASDGTYLAIGNITHDSAYYYVPKFATITSVSSSAQKANNSTKGFEIETAASGTVLTFNHTAWTYRDDMVNVRLNEEDEMKCYVDNIGQAVKNTIVTLEIKWRYVDA